MRTRANRIEFHLSDKEYSHFKKLVKKSGLNFSQYLRQIIKGIIPKDLPPPDYFEMMRMLYKIGTNINQIALKTNALNHIDAEKYERYFEEYRKDVLEIKQAVTGSIRKEED